MCVGHYCIPGRRGNAGLEGDKGLPGPRGFHGRKGDADTTFAQPQADVANTTFVLKIFLKRSRMVYSSQIDRFEPFTLTMMFIFRIDVSY